MLNVWHLMEPLSIVLYQESVYLSPYLTYAYADLVSMGIDNREGHSTSLRAIHSHKKLIVSRYQNKLDMTALWPLEATFGKCNAGASNDDSSTLARDTPTSST
ncbi:hypothetical protein PIIN_08941 [Serendipita indica DSM 11827]|uniref:Uncharacterized protein n=1 Tax=Serendipita indica (strain DSM 11827) TaxID=1109443 RepID=G4TUG8_SERID|nr:hypothetical protein PIIN_08941 [Serendipita indica DSM 11827]